MRQGSNFSGTEEELVKLMKESLKHIIEDELWLFNLNESNSISEQEIINIHESLAECVERGYFYDAAYNVLMNKRIAFHPKTTQVVIVPEGTPQEEIDNSHSNMPLPFSLTRAGEDFMNS